MDFLKRVRRLEDVLGKDTPYLGVAIRRPCDGTIAWDDRVFPDEKSFQKAVEATYADSPIVHGLKVILITVYRSQPR